jgi:hypothetical protein
MVISHIRGRLKDREAGWSSATYKVTLRGIVNQVELIRIVARPVRAQNQESRWHCSRTGGTPRGSAMGVEESELNGL